MGKQNKGTKDKNVNVETRFPGVTSFRELSILAKNSAAGADDAYKSCAELSKEVDNLVSQIARFRNPVEADESKRNELSGIRAKLRDERDYKERALALAKSRGAALEKAADEYAYLVYRLKHEKVNYRKTERFAEPNVNISNHEVRALASHLSGKERLQARFNILSTGSKVFESVSKFFVKAGNCV